MIGPVRRNTVAFAVLSFTCVCGVSLADQNEPVKSGSAPVSGGSGGTPANSKTPQIVGKLPDSMVANQTPAQKAYGLPRNPTTAPVDLDLTKALTMDHAISLGLAFQNSIAISKSNIDIADSRLTQARSSYYPQVTPSFQYQSSLTPAKRFNVDPVTGLPASRLANRSIQSDLTNSGIQASQLIYDTGKREANVALNRRNVFAAEYGLANQRQLVILAVAQDYYNLLRYRELIKEDVKSVARYQQTLDIITVQANVGTAAKSDIYQANADLANAQVTLLQDKSNYQVEESNLKNAMGITSSSAIVLPEAVLPQPSPSADANALENYVKLAYMNRLDAKQQQESVYAQGYALKLARIQSGITVDASIIEGYALQPISGEDRTFAVTFSYPLFDGGNTRAAIRENKAILEQQRRTLDQLQQSIRLEVATAYEVREIARQRVVAAKIALDAGEQNLTVVREKQQNQLASLPDIIVAERQRDTAGVSLVEAIYDFYVGNATLERSIAVNDPGYLPKVPGIRAPTRAPVVP